MNNGIMVNPAELSSFGSFLISSAGRVSGNLSDIQKAMQALGSAWNDQVGAEYAAKFNQFIIQSTAMCELMNTVGQNVVSKANDYQTIIVNALNRMR